jgi:hypothetical protein
MMVAELNNTATLSSSSFELGIEILKIMTTSQGKEATHHIFSSYTYIKEVV